MTRHARQASNLQPWQEANRRPSKGQRPHARHDSSCPRLPEAPAPARAHAPPRRRAGRSAMRVGAYIDGLNLFYGGRELCGRDRPGWRWLDLRQLCERLLAERRDWGEQRPLLHRVVYCTAFIDGQINEAGRKKQGTYVRALRAHGSFDHLEEGKFVARTRSGFLAAVGSRGRPVVTRSRWPVLVRDRRGRPVHDAHFMVSYLSLQEKGSDVNVATHLLKDVLGERVDAAIVISNDGDLRLPLQVARLAVPVGTVNPSNRTTAGDLRGRGEGAGSHWWRKLTAEDFLSCQMPEVVGDYGRPEGW